LDDLSIVAVLGGFWLFHLLAVVSPGPSLIIVTQTSISVSRRAGVANALGFGVGSIIWAFAAIFGLGILFTALPWVYVIVKTAGALYLIFLASKLLRSDGIVDAVGSQGAVAVTSLEAFNKGLAIQLSNPKVVIFMGSILTTLLPQSPSPLLLAWVLTIIFLNEFIWYSLVATMFSIRRVREPYAKVSKVVDRVAGLLLGALGVRILSQ
jgi:threonine/homoserine/homoserine lactone efflux protein